MFTIYEPDGIHPAPGAMATFYEINSITTQPVSVFLTNIDGHIFIEGIPCGIYRCWVEKDSLALFQDSILITQSQSTFRSDTLERTAALSGIIEIPPFFDPRAVTILPLGTGKKVTVTNEDGRFTVKGLVRGIFTLLIEDEHTKPVFIFKEVNVTKVPTDTIRDTLHLYSTGIPAISEIHLKQDTLNETILLSWKKSSYTNFLDYVVFREKCSDVNLTKKSYYVTTDTFLIDDIRSLLPDDPKDTSFQCLNYWVALRSNQRITGPAVLCATIPAVSKAYVSTIFTHYAINVSTDSSEYASINDTILFSIHAHNKTRLLQRLVWFDPVKKDTLVTRVFEDSLKSDIRDSLLYTFSSTDAHYLYVIITDNANIEWRDSIPAYIIDDVPFANAGNDTGIFAGEKVYLHGSAQQQFGSITKWQWKTGLNGSWIETPGPDIMFIAQPSEEAVVCSLAVTDDDGNVSFDEVLVFVSEKISSITAGANYSLIRTVDSSVWSFGLNKYGQLGDGTSENQYSPILMTSNVVDMSAGNGHTLILRDDRTLLGCGYNRNGQLGDGSENSCTFLIQIATDVQHIKTGSYHSMILKTDGSLWTCGRNTYGQLGDSTFENRSTPVLVMQDVQDMAAGLFHSMILKTDGTLWTCGCDSLGQLGDSADSNHPWPLQIMTEVKGIAAGENHSLILKTDGSVWACGDNYYGQLGDGTYQNRPVPVQIATDVKSIAAGASHSLITKNDGSLFCCGHNGYGQLGDGTTNFSSTLKSIMTDVQSAAAGKYHTIILKKDGSLWVCGYNYNGELGNMFLGFGIDKIQPAPKRAIPFRKYEEKELKL
jgi:alpha-tubulin suppressor-like RCC1 family protein